MCSLRERWLAAGFGGAQRDVAQTNAGWALIASVDTRPKDGEPGGQYVSSVADSSGALGRFRYLLLEVQPTSARDVFGQTFFSEIDVVERNGPALAAGGATTNATPITKSFTAGEGRYHFTLNATVAPDLMEWAGAQLRPVVQEWYPRLVDLLPSEGFRAPTNVTIRFRDNMGTVPRVGGRRLYQLQRGVVPARASSARRWARWCMRMVHVVQSSGSNRRGNPNATRRRAGSWRASRITSAGFFTSRRREDTEITRRNLEKARHDASYRVSGNFFDWV